MEEDIEKLIKELTKVRPEMLNEEALKLFNTIIAIIDERDYLLKAYKQDEEVIDEMAQTLLNYGFVLIKSKKGIIEFFRKQVETNE